MDDQNKNLILATVLSFIVIAVWFTLFPPPERPAAVSGTEVATPAAAPAAVVGDGIAGGVVTSTAVEADTAPRIAIETPNLSGSISLRGGRIDTVFLNKYSVSLKDDAKVELLRPEGGNDAFYANYGWVGPVDPALLPNENTVWSISSGDILTPETPITLSWDNNAGQIFFLTYSIDDKYMFDVTQRVENNGGDAIDLRPYGLLRRHTEPDNQKNFFILHEGLVHASDGTLTEADYGDMQDYPRLESERTQAQRTEITENGWIGFTEHYWMAVLIPAPGTPFRAVSKYVQSLDVYQTDTVLPAQSVAPGSSMETKTRLFVGAKEWEAITTYEDVYGIQGFVNSIDWGWFFFLTKPIFWVLHVLNQAIGNMGWSIIALTVVLKALVLPLAYKSYVSMAKMKELQPEMEKLKEHAGDDRAKLQQGMIKLYKDNKVNPASGCLPILLQIPIFFSLYKVIFVTIELRHAAWVGWVQDLSAPDPTSILNLFGALPWATPEPGSFFFIFSLGILPIFLGISMWLQQKLNPTPTDPTQKMIFGLMPWIFMFMLGSFASGLVLYWITNNTITFMQQYTIMRMNGHKPDVFGNIIASFRRDKTQD